MQIYIIIEEWQNKANVVYWIRRHVGAFCLFAYRSTFSTSTTRNAIRLQALSMRPLCTYVCIMRTHVPSHRRMQIQYISLPRIKYVPGNRRIAFARFESFVVLYGCVIAKRRHVKFLYDGMNRGLKTARFQ